MVRSRRVYAPCILTLTFFKYSFFGMLPCGIGVGWMEYGTHPWSAPSPFPTVNSPLFYLYASV